jgi:AcrR family transcriptional regulator
MSKSKQRILNTASKLFSEFGFLGASMEDIARHLKITKAALYYHFESKKELYLQVLEKSFQDLISTIDKQILKTKPSKQFIVQLIETYLDFGLKEKNLIRVLNLKSPDIDPGITSYIVKLRRQVNQHFQTSLKKWFKKDLAGKINLQFIISSLLGIMDRLILEATLFNKKLNTKKESSRILKFIKPILKVES